MRSNQLLFPILVICLAFAACKKPEVADCSGTAGTVAQSSNPEIEALRQSMLTFRNSLSEDLLARGTTCLGTDRAIRWHNTPPSITPRDGITYGDLSDTQLQNFKNMMQLFLSQPGYQKVDEITTLSEGYLNSIETVVDWGTETYSIDLIGDPNTSGSWGFQLDGHHCAVNFLVHGDYVSMVPAFLGGEPVVGTFNGTSFDIFRDERDLALNLYNGMNQAEIASAVTTGDPNAMVLKPGEGGSEDPYAGNYDYSQFQNGLRYTDMTSATKANLIILMYEYVYNLDSTFADTWWNDVFANIDDTWFVWIDEVSAPSTTTQFYYRIYNPYLWVEYSMEPPVGDGLEDWNHVHTITRIPNNPSTANGGDYGLFAEMVNRGGPKTLYEHYYSAAHHQGTKMLFDYQVEMPDAPQDGHSHEHGDHEHGGHSHSQGYGHHHHHGHAG